MPYLVSGHSRSSHIVHSRDVSRDHVEDSLTELQERRKREAKIYLNHSPHRVYPRMSGAPLSLAEVFPIVFRRRAVGPLVNRSARSALPLSHRISNENWAWEAHANSKCREILATSVKGRGRNHLSVTIWLDRDLTSPALKKWVPTHVSAGDGDSASSRDKNNYRLG